MSSVLSSRTFFELNKKTIFGFIQLTATFQSFYIIEHFFINHDNSAMKISKKLYENPSITSMKIWG